MSLYVADLGIHGVTSVSASKVIQKEDHQVVRIEVEFKVGETTCKQTITLYGEDIKVG